MNRTERIETWLRGDSEALCWALAKKKTQDFGSHFSHLDELAQTEVFFNGIKGVLDYNTTELLTLINMLTDGFIEEMWELWAERIEIEMKEYRERKDNG